MATSMEATFQQAVSIPGWRGSHEHPPLADEFLTADSFWETESIFFKASMFTMLQAPVADTTAVSYGQHNADSVGYFI